MHRRRCNISRCIIELSLQLFRNYEVSKIYGSKKARYGKNYYKKLKKDLKHRVKNATMKMY